MDMVGFSAVGVKRVKRSAMIKQNLIKIKGLIDYHACQQYLNIL